MLSARDSQPIGQSHKLEADDAPVMSARYPTMARPQAAGRTSSPYADRNELGSDRQLAGQGLHRAGGGVSQNEAQPWRDPKRQSDGRWTWRQGQVIFAFQAPGHTTSQEHSCRDSKEPTASVFRVTRFPKEIRLECSPAQSLEWSSPSRQASLSPRAGCDSAG